jgi:hypothetical protein
MGAGEERAYLERLFPEFKAFRDERLREQVLATWINVWHRSKFRRLEAARFMPDTPKRSLVAHVRAVARNALAIADNLALLHGIRVDRDMALARLHDASKIQFAHHRLESVILHAGDMADAEALDFDAGIMNARLKFVRNCSAENAEGRRERSRLWKCGVLW